MANCVNLTRIQETSDGDLEFEQELIEMFLEDARDHLAALKTQVEQNDADMIRRSAHTLKGSSSNIGATKMQEMAYQMELLAKESVLDNAKAHVAKMEEALEETAAFYKKYLDSVT